jgi:hypothetical protein
MHYACYWCGKLYVTFLKYTLNNSIIINSLHFVCM